MSSKGPPPKLQFDDGTRIMQGESVYDDSTCKSTTSPLLSSRDPAIPIEQYYEIERVSNEVIEKLLLKGNISNQEQLKTIKVALQFPDNLLVDAPDVCFLLEEILLDKLDDMNIDILIFLLGDTSTHGSCCVDEVAALHLSADLVVHYGRACLSPTKYLPVVYSFGMQPINAEHVAQSALDELESCKCTKLIVLCDVSYYYSMGEIKTCLHEKLKSSDDFQFNVILGTIPSKATHKKNLSFRNSLHSCCISRTDNEHTQSISCHENQCSVNEIQEESILNSSNNSSNSVDLIIGGLSITLPHDQSLSDYTILFIGDNSQQLLSIMMRCSGRNGAHTCWAYIPTLDGKDGCINTNAASVCQRELNRRFFLTQKAKMAGIIGIVVGSLTNAHYTKVVTRLRRCIEDSGRTSYTFAVGKINVNKLANFGEIDCYVLVACPENSLLESRDFHVPIITPFELEIALGVREWDGFYSSEFSDYLKLPVPEITSPEKGSSSDDDQPFFSMVSGTYESRPKFVEPNSHINLNIDNGPPPQNYLQSQITEYRSEAANFLKKREYQGLKAKIGESQVMPAVKGKTGIASDYGEGM